MIALCTVHGNIYGTSIAWLEMLSLLSFGLKKGSIVVKCKIFIVRKALFTPENMTITFVKRLIKQDSGVQLMGVNSAYEDSAEDGCTFKEGRNKVEQNFCSHTCDFHSLRPHP